MNVIKPSHMSGAGIDAWLGIGKSTRHSWQDSKSPYYDAAWPVPIKLGTRKTVYITDEVETWLAARPRSRDVKPGKEE